MLQDATTCTAVKDNKSSSSIVKNMKSKMAKPSSLSRLTQPIDPSIHLTPVYTPTFFEFLIDGIVMTVLAKAFMMLSYGSYMCHLGLVFFNMAVSGILSRFFIISLLSLLMHFAFDMDELNGTVLTSLIYGSQPSKYDD